MSNKRFEMYEYRQIIAHIKAGESDRAVGRSGLAERTKVSEVRKIAIQQGWLDKNADLPSDEELANFFVRVVPVEHKQSSVEIYKQQIELWHQQGIQSSTIYLTLQRQYAFSGSYHCVQRFVKKLEKQNVEVTTILNFKPGECAQVDFGYGPKLINEQTGDEIKTWIFVMTLAWSRHQYSEIILKQDVDTWLGCHRRAFEWFNGVPQKIIIDNAKCAITKACYYEPTVQRAYYDFAQGYGFIISACPPREPKKKGRVESGVKYVKNNFVPLRTFRNQHDTNQQLKQWILETAGNRIHGSTREKPLTLFAETEQVILKPLPANPPENLVWVKVMLHTDCHVQYLQCRYSAPHEFVKQILWLSASGSVVKIFHETKMIAIHARSIKPGSVTTLLEHLPHRISAYLIHDAQWCVKAAQNIGEFCYQIVEEWLTDPVVDYLRAAQSLICLASKYGNARLEAACKRAHWFQSMHYKTIHEILKKGVEYEVITEETAFDFLAETYTGNSHFCRNTSTLLQ